MTRLRKHASNLEKGRAWRRDNPDRVRASIVKFHARNPLWSIDNHLQRTHGLTICDYTDIVMLQGNRCAACRSPDAGRVSRSGKPGRFIVDHCHATGAIRGIVCHPCNAILGMIKDRSEHLSKLIDYLQRSK